VDSKTLSDKLNVILAEYRRKQNDEERSNHVSSGKLNPSGLGQPTQWQVLRILGVPQKQVDDYTLGVFRRGRSTEDDVIEEFEGIGIVKSKQTKIEWNGMFGYVDVVMDLTCIGLRELPIEIKSVKNAKWARIVKSGKPDESNAIQASCYALARKESIGIVMYVSAEDYRVMIFAINPSDYLEKINNTVQEVQNCLKHGFVPRFEPKESWQALTQYNNYPEWSQLSEEEIEYKLKKEFPKAYKKLKGEDDE
jgi:hypothetical protein